ncbi:DNA repair protein RecO [Halopseudomonas salegens]|uniref:DNA repair protein RecO n=1 Tax=Halopseudomonas salegens TaxID=1434072 RepID=A0A1H2EEY5_9GAMM|nr:DNA repair protein RecO [Halopseudomonas salegens]SDT93549.1 DNA replication and repair protein RecO [Halopseudomonas salegens]
MAQANALIPAYVLHSRPYRDSSALVDLLTLQQGRQRVVWRGARGGRKGSLTPQPFQPLLLSLTGRGELKTLQQAERAGSLPGLQGNALFSGLYLNELLARLLLTDEPQPLIFAGYQSAIQGLAEQQSLEPLLRRFEWLLLNELGYGFSLQQDANGQPLQAEYHYQWQAEHGLLPVQGGQPGIPGATLLAMAADDWSAADTLRWGKRLMRQALAVHLGDKPLHSRQLFTATKEIDHD